MNSEVVKNFLNGYSIEVTPNAAAKIENFAEVLPVNTRIYIAHIEGTPFDEMLKLQKKLQMKDLSQCLIFQQEIDRGIVRYVLEPISW